MKKTYFLFIILLFLFGTTSFLYSKSFHDARREAFGLSKIDKEVEKEKDSSSSEENNQSDTKNLNEKITEAVELKEVKKLSPEEQQKELKKVKKMFFARKTAKIRKRYAEAVLPRYVYTGNYAVVKFLLDKTSLDLKKIDKKGGNILIPAIWTGDVKLVKLLLDKGADANKEGNYIYIDKNRTNTYQIPININTALMWAAIQGHLEVVKYLVESGAKIEAKNNDSRTSLMWAADDGHLEVVKYLVSKRAEKTGLPEDILKQL